MFSTAGPTQSGASLTGWPSRSASRVTAGASDISGLTWPLGRPRWLIRITFPPASTAALIVGRAALIRLSSVTFCPSSSGTLKSTRIRTRLPLRSSLSTVSFAMTGLLLQIGNDPLRSAAAKPSHTQMVHNTKPPRKRPYAGTTSAAVCQRLASPSLTYRAASFFIRSTMRHEKPHSLSYHERTLTMLPPMTMVQPASKILEWLSPTMSVSTIGSSV